MRAGIETVQPASASRREFLALSSSLVLATGPGTALGLVQPQSAKERMLTNLSASAAVKAMRDGDLESEDYAAACLAQAERWKSLNAFRTLHPASVLEAARAADKKRASGRSLGALHGLPLAVKDSINTRDLPTSNGTAALRNFRPRRDAEVLGPLLSAGALVFGKTNLHELSCGWSSNNQAFGAVLNPYDLRRTPGGSSGGSAAAVAAHVVPLAIGGDTYGSIRVPASFCGLAGLRCTFRRYPDGGVMPLAKNKFDQVGPLARTVEDLILFDSVVTGAHDPVGAVPLRGVRIGLSPELLGQDIDPETGRIVEAALQRVSAAGATLVHAELPQQVRNASDVERSILGYELLPSLKAFLEQYQTGVSLEQLISQASPNLAPLLNGSRNPGPPEHYTQLLRQMDDIKAATMAHFRRHRLDAIAFAPTLMPAFVQGDAQQVEIDGHAIDLFTAIGRQVGVGSCAGLSCLVLPAGVTTSGLPVGLEFDGPPDHDRRLLAIGLSLERALGPIGAPRLPEARGA
jgi:indoleacetamide hydrolase